MRQGDYFYLAKDLHRILKINRPADLVTTWSYPKKAAVKYIWSEIQRISLPAFTDKQVQQMLNRKRDVLVYAYVNGFIKKPYKTYNIETGIRTKGSPVIWHPDDVLALHEVLTEEHDWNKTKPGAVAANIPSRLELIAMMNHGLVQYIKTKDGEFVPSWVAK